MKSLNMGSLWPVYRMKKHTGRITVSSLNLMGHPWWELGRS